MRVLTIGTFDILHPGHVELLAECRTIAGSRPDGRVLVGVNRDEFVERYKGRPPTQPLAHRMEVVGALRDVDSVHVNSGDEYAGKLIDEVSPGLIVIGDDWLDEGHDETRYLAQLGVTRRWLVERALSIRYVPRTRGVSTTQLRFRS